MLIERKQEEVILKPITKLSTLRGIDELERASEEVGKLREEWDEDLCTLVVS